MVRRGLNTGCFRLFVYSLAGLGLPCIIYMYTWTWPVISAARIDGWCSAHRPKEFIPTPNAKMMLSTYEQVKIPNTNAMLPRFSTPGVAKGRRLLVSAKADSMDGTLMCFSAKPGGDRAQRDHHYHQCHFRLPAAPATSLKRMRCPRLRGHPGSAPAGAGDRRVGDVDGEGGARGEAVDAA